MLLTEPVKKNNKKREIAAAECAKNQGEKYDSTDAVASASAGLGVLMLFGFVVLVICNLTCVMVCMCESVFCLSKTHDFDTASFQSTTFTFTASDFLACYRDMSG